MTTDNIDRRTFVSRMLAWSSLGSLWALSGFDWLSKRSATSLTPLATTDAWEIQPGSRVGKLGLGMTEDDVISVLGSPDERREHPGCDFEKLIRVSKKLGVPPDELPTKGIEPSVSLSFRFHGLETTLIDNTVRRIFVHTGVPSGHEKCNYWPLRGAMDKHSLSPITSISDVQRRLGPPSRTGENEYAPIPQAWISYDSGITFDFCSATGKLSIVRIISAIS